MPIFHLREDGSLHEFTEVQLPEEDLRNLFEGHGLRFIEKGLRKIGRNVAAGDGFIDTFAIDKNARPTIIEYKIAEKDTHEALIQALDYADVVLSRSDEYLRLINRELKGNSMNEEDVDFDGLRIVLVAPAFDSRLVRAAHRVEPSVQLVTYHVGAEGAHRAISVMRIYDSETVRAPRDVRLHTIAEKFEGRYAAMRPLFEKIHDHLVALGPDVVPYAKQQYIAFRRNRMFAAVHNYTDRLDLGLALEKGTQPPAPLREVTEMGSSRITHGLSLRTTEDLSPVVLEAMKAAYLRS